MTIPPVGQFGANWPRRRIRTCLLSLGMVLAPSSSLAIPSPELVIGSVSSLSQVLAVGLATLTAGGTLFAKRLGFDPKSTRAMARFPARLIALLVLLVCTFGALNIWQFRAYHAEELARLQGTLVRPAQFDGTQIHDEDLIETNFDGQTKNQLSLSTAKAHGLLKNLDNSENLQFFDVRETSEFRMGSLPGARHIRFPDFLQSSMQLEGKKVILFCHNGNRSSETCMELAARGIDCSFIAGGIEKWIVEGRSFSDAKIETLSDLRAIPEYPNKTVLLSSADFKALLENTELQIVDTRYPGDFATGHLPGAINIPVRALPTDELKRQIAALEPKPTIAACYDRRSCFMAQVLGLEMSEAGIDFRGRYTTPWDYFIPPKPKPHVEAWLAEQQMSLWQAAVNNLSQLLNWVGETSHFVLGLFALSLSSRLLVLPIALKSERDQIENTRHANTLKALKKQLRNDPTRRARAIRQFHAENGMSPMRNLIALLFLPIMMLGLSAAEQASSVSSASFLWLTDLSQQDKVNVLPVLFALLASVYFQAAIAKTKRQAIFCWLLGAPIMFALVFRLSAAANIYLCISIILLLLQRAYVSGALRQIQSKVSFLRQHWTRRWRVPGVIPLDQTSALMTSGNKAYRLSVMKNAGLPVPDGVVIQSRIVNTFGDLKQDQRKRLSDTIWQNVGKKPCAVRSSGSKEDGSEQSYAGVFDSVLNVDQKGMCDALEQVVASFSSARAKSYDVQSKASDDGNVLVQQMVCADYSGVLFTQDPTAPGLTMVELVEGCGDNLVSGRVTPQNFRFGRYSQSPVDSDVGPIDLEPLLALGKQIESLFNHPQDIEWAYADGAFKILQSRDITRLTAKNPSEKARIEEWSRIFDLFRGRDTDSIVLEQDELSEVLPRPTALSFSLMAQLWAPGGSLDLACRQLGVSYNLPEGRPGHLVNFFGRTFVDSQLKHQMALRLNKRKAKQLRKLSRECTKTFQAEVMPALQEDIVLWQAVDFASLPKKQILSSIQAMRRKFIYEFYAEAEKINILASFAMTEAVSTAETDSDAWDRLMHPVLHHAPMNMVDACAGLEVGTQKSALMALMGHRAVYDYELQMPRYCESPELLWPLLKSAAPTSNTEPVDFITASSDPISVAIALQDLKELAKHEALRYLAEIRRALLALADETGLGDDIFHLEIEELEDLSGGDPKTHQIIAQQRKENRERLLRHAPRQVTLTLNECELLSASVPLSDHQAGAALGGTCVAGSKNASGRVFKVQDDTTIDSDAFIGFSDGDIIVCRIANPAWLPYIQRSAGLLCEVGGWLSHIAIVAREKDILMQVGCLGMDQLHDGVQIEVGIEGSIVILESKASRVSH